MSNAITTPKAGGVAALQSLRSGLAQVRPTLSAAVGGMPLLRLLKDGQWVVGAEDTVVQPGTEAVINPISMQSGYSCWTNRAPGQGKNELMGEEMWGLNSPKPPASSLPVHHDPRTQDLCQWKDAMSVDLKMMGGAMLGQQVQYKTTSVGGLRVMSAIVDAIMAKLDTGSEYVFPVVQLLSDSYNHNSYGRTYVPVMEIVAWCDMNGVEEDAEPTGPVPSYASPVNGSSAQDRAATAAAKAQDAAVAQEAAARAAAQPEPQAAPAGRRRRV